MNIEDIVKEIPFQLNLGEYKTKEEFLAAFSKHLNIVATKAEYLGYDDLTEAIDIMRKYLPRLDCMTKSEKEEWTEANRIVGSYTNRYSDEGHEEEQMLKDEIVCACEEAQEKYNDYLKACDMARNKEKEFREKYGEPSGVMNENFYNNYEKDEDEL